MKNINNLLTLLTTLLLLAACEKEGDKFFLSTPEGNELIVSTDAIILKEEAAKLYAMSLAWTEQTLQINDSRYEPTTGIETTVQASLTEDFSGNIQESCGKRPFQKLYSRCPKCGCLPIRNYRNQSHSNLFPFSRKKRKQYRSYLQQYCQSNSYTIFY